jgi:hypothetical protein
VTGEHAGREYLEAAFGAQEDHRRACIEDAKQDPASVWFEGSRPRPAYVTDPDGAAYEPRCEKYAHEGQLGGLCRERIRDTRRDGTVTPWYECRSRVVAYNPATGTPFERPEDLSSETASVLRSTPPNSHPGVGMRRNAKTGGQPQVRGGQKRPTIRAGARKLSRGERVGADRQAAVAARRREKDRERKRRAALTQTGGRRERA